MIKKIKYLLFALSALISNNAVSQEEDRGYIVNVGEMAPDFTATLTDGTKFKLSENRGKIIMLQVSIKETSMW